MNIWEVYKTNLRSRTKDEKLKVFLKDAPEIREQITWTMYILDTTSPAAGVGHQWNVAKNMLGAEIDKINKTYNKFMECPNEDNAMKFAEALDGANAALSTAKNAMWYNNFLRRKKVKNENKGN